MLFRFGLLATLLLALAILLILLVSTLIEAWPVLIDQGMDFVTSDTSSLPERAGVWQGLVGSLILIGFVAAIALPIGIAAAIYLQEYTRDTRISRILIANIRNLAGVPSVVYGILGLVVFVKALSRDHGSRQLRAQLHLGRAHAGRPGDADRDPDHDGGAARRAVEHPRGRVRRRRHALGGRAVARAPERRAGHLHGRDPGAGPRVRRDRAAAAGRRGDRVLLVGRRAARPLEVLQGPYTALPTQIFSWAKLPANDWQPNTAAAIIVLLVAILVVNFLAILLRNRYERTW